MDAADDSRQQWASLLAGKSNLPTLALGSWLGLVASTFGAAPWPVDSPLWHESTQSSTNGDTAQPAVAHDTLGWAAAAVSILNAWTSAVGDLQGSTWTWPLPAGDNPLARVLGHPAVVVGSENSPGRLSMQSGMALVDFMQAAMAHQGLQAQGWAKALQRFMAEFLPNNDDGAQPVVVASLDELATHWGIVGEAALQEHSRSEQFLRSQAEMMRKSMRHRIAQRRAVEATLRANDMPTLTDLDEAFASIHALRSEVRGLRRLMETTASAYAAANSSAVQSKARSKHSAGRARKAA